jgi:alpha-L-fucosidase
MPSSANPLSRRQFIATAGAAATGAAALPLLSPATAAAAPAAVDGSPGKDLQKLLSRFVDLRFGMFIHYSLGTYTDEEWAAPDQSPAVFAPPSVDCAQWASAARSAGMEYAVLTTKHHDGFSLWPTAHGTQNVMHSGYQHDVVQQYVDAFRAEGLRVGFYFSIWDRTEPIQSFGGHVPDQTKSVEPADMDVILGQITELLTGYGKIDVLMTDGYTWQMGMQQVNYRRIHELVKKLQPNCLLTDICAVTQPWLGDMIFWEEPLGIRAPAGNTDAGLQGQTISNGWFWHPSTPTAPVMSLEDITGHLADLEPKYTSFLLNCPPNRDGRLDANIVNRLAEVGAAWSPDESRPPLPAQPVKVEWPVVPVAAHGSAFRAPEPPYHAIDGRGDRDFETCWSTWPGTGELALPATLTLDLGGTWSDISTFQYLPKQWRRTNTTDGDITRARVSVSTDGVHYEEVAVGAWGANPRPKTLERAPRDVAYVQLEVLAGTGGYSNVNGVKIGGRKRKPVRRPHPLVGRRVRLDNAGSRLSLTATADGVVQAAADDSAAQHWILREAEDGYWYVENLGLRNLLTLVGTERASGAPLGTAAEQRAFQQHWALTGTESGDHVLTNRFNTLTLGTPGQDDGAGVAAQLLTPALSDQYLRWSLVDVTPLTGVAFPEVRPEVVERAR